MAIDGVSFALSNGTLTALVGPNGAGKTTCFYMITGLISPNSGKIFLNKKNITSLSIDERANLGLGYLAQEPSIFRGLSVKDNIFAILEQRNDISDREKKDKLDYLLNKFNIEHIKNTMGVSLSGGERRRAEIARALASDPKFILLDEPFAGVDPIAIQDIQDMIKKLKDRDIGVLITDHNVRETLSITDRSYLLYDGKILKYGKTSELVNDNEVRKLYLGDNFRF